MIFPMPMPQIQLSQAGYADEQILEMARSDSDRHSQREAITLKLIGLSNPTVQAIVHRRIAGLPTLTSEQIGRLKNTGMSEKQILDLVNQGLSNDQAEKIDRQSRSQPQSLQHWICSQSWPQVLTDFPPRLLLLFFPSD